MDIMILALIIGSILTPILTSIITISSIHSECVDGVCDCSVKHTTED